MNKKDFKGFKHIFSFTFIQYVKAKSFKISCMILCVILFAAFPVMSFLSKTDRTNEATTVSFDKVYIVGADEAWKDAFVNICKQNEMYAPVSFELTDKSIDEINSDLEAAGDDVSYICMEIADINSAYVFIYYGKNSAVSEGDVNYLGYFIEENGTRIATAAFNIDDSIASAVGYGVDTEGYTVIEETYDDSAEDVFTTSEYAATYIMLFVLMLFILFASEAVAMSIITEKSTRVVEYLLVSIKPIALIAGKIVAMLCAVGIQILALAMSAGLGVVVTGFIFPNPDGSFAIPALLTTLVSEDLFVGLNVPNLIVALLIMLLGLLEYGFIAGLAGATVSKVEEAAEGLKYFTMAVLVGVYICYGYASALMGGGDWGAFDIIPHYLPLSSPFIMPSLLLMGEITIQMALISVVVLVITVILLLLLVSRVYEYLIYHRGAPVKIKQLISMAKEKKSVKK